MKLSAPNLTLDDYYAAAKDVEAGQLDPGPAAEDFAIALAERWGVPRSYVLLTNSCTTAITLVTRFLGGMWKVPVLTWPGSYCGIPNYELVDTHHNGLLLRHRPYPEQKLHVNLWGRQDLNYTHCDVHDSAHCLFPRRMLTSVMEHKEAWCFSFGPTKEITTLRGGAVVWHRAEELRDHIGSGARNRIPTRVWGLNGTITEVGARLGLSQLERFADSRGQRKNVLAFYEGILKDTDISLETKCNAYSGHLAVVAFSNRLARNVARDILRESGIPWGHHYPLPHSNAGFEDWKYARRISQRVLTLPCHPHLTAQDFKRLGAALSRVKRVIRPASEEQTTE